VDAASSTAAATINAQLVLAAAAVGTNNQDMRCTCIAIDNLTAAAICRLPIGNTIPEYGRLVAVGAAARSVAYTDGTDTITAATTGTSNIVAAEGYFGSGVTPLPGDPTNTANDLVVTLTPTGGAISRVFLFLWWS
jgi:hypothetical protein